MLKGFLQNLKPLKKKNLKNNLEKLLIEDLISFMNIISVKSLLFIFKF